MPNPLQDNHISYTPADSISWTDISPQAPEDNAPWLGMAINTNSLLAVSDGESFYVTANLGGNWAQEAGAPGSLSIALSDVASLGSGPGPYFAGLTPEYQAVTAAGAQYASYEGYSATPRVASAPLSTLIMQNAATYGIDPDTFARQLYNESHFCPNVVSFDNGQGIAQWTPPFPAGYKIQPFNPANAIQNAGAYLKSFLGMFYNNLGLALAAYNSGEATVQNYLNGGAAPPTITQNYVLLITGHTIAEWAAQGYKVIAADQEQQTVDVSGSSGAQWKTQQPKPGTVPNAVVAMSASGADAVCASGSAMWTTRNLGKGG